MSEPNFEEMAADVTCCAGPMCCERRVAKALRAAHLAGRVAGLREATARVESQRNVYCGIMESAAGVSFAQYNFAVAVCENLLIYFKAIVSRLEQEAKGEGLPSTTRPENMSPKPESGDTNILSVSGTRCAVIHTDGKCSHGQWEG